MEEDLLKVQKLESIGVLAGGIAHDFNNLLGIILGNLSVAQMYLDLSKEGTEAISELRKAIEANEPFDAVILDLTVKGGMGGRETIEELLRIDPSVRAVVSSGYSNDPVMSRYRDYGFSGVLSKPYEIRQLDDVLRGIVACSRE